MHIGDRFPVNTFHHTQKYGEKMMPINLSYVLLLNRKSLLTICYDL